jgi:hypothetical protein
MATDIYGNEVGNFAIIEAGEAEKTISKGGRAAAMNIQINYQQPIQPVATFGKDVIFAKGVAQGTFSIGMLAGNSAFKNGASSCKGESVSVDFGIGKCAKMVGTIGGQKLKDSKVTMVGAVFNGFSIQGAAQDAFFTQNVSGFFHYLA